jgi:thioredoxin-related protein
LNQGAVSSEGRRLDFLAREDGLRRRGSDWFGGEMKFGRAILFVALGCVSSLAQSSKPSNQQSSVSAASSTYVPVHRYDPSRNAVTDIEKAIGEAQRTGKRIILEVGGDWCSWCHALDRFFQEHPDVVQLRDENFITVYVYYNSENKNEQALSRYYNSKVLGIPHFFVLDKDGSLLKSEEAANLETTDSSYSAEKMHEFLTKWSPRSETPEKNANQP